MDVFRGQAHRRDVRFWGALTAVKHGSRMIAADGSINLMLNSYATGQILRVEGGGSLI
jgi:hypothetical protein